MTNQEAKAGIIWVVKKGSAQKRIGLSVALLFSPILFIPAFGE
ncbi:hypothetical protein ACHHV8_23370 [Paenibacillus sp. TAB 01]